MACSCHQALGEPGHGQVEVHSHEQPASFLRLCKPSPAARTAVPRLAMRQVVRFMRRNASATPICLVSLLPPVLAPCSQFNPPESFGWAGWALRGLSDEPPRAAWGVPGGAQWRGSPEAREAGRSRHAPQVVEL
eukprot:scaffold151591_cov29-Tisochrysis_lutea.AAC.1